MRLKMGSGKGPFFDLQVSDKVVIVLLLLVLGGGATEIIPVAMHVLLGR